MMKTDREILKAVPKVELHLHLDCSLSYEVVKKLNPQVTFNQYKNDFIALPKCINLEDFLRCTGSSIGLMQIEEGLNEVTADLFRQLKDENVIYAEIRFAPLQHLMQNLTAEEVVEIVSDAFRRNSAIYNIPAGLILCTLRHYSEAQSMATIKLVEKYRGNNIVCGFDIAADEAGFPVDNHKSAFEYAIKKEIPRTAHAGEAKGAESVWETLNYFAPQRIGHGVRSIEDDNLIEHLIQNNIHLEVCPSCNVQIDVFDTYANHPINRLYNYGVSVGINTDARSLVNVTLTDEYVKLMETFGWTLGHFYNCNKNALRSSFASDSEKIALLKKLDELKNSTLISD